VRFTSQRRCRQNVERGVLKPVRDSLFRRWRCRWGTAGDHRGPLFWRWPWSFWTKMTASPCTMWVMQSRSRYFAFLDGVTRHSEAQNLMRRKDLIPCVVVRVRAWPVLLHRPQIVLNVSGLVCYSFNAVVPKVGGALPSGGNTQFFWG